MQETSMKDEKETLKMAARIYAEARPIKLGALILCRIYFDIYFKVVNKVHALFRLN